MGKKLAKMKKSELIDEITALVKRNIELNANVEEHNLLIYKLNVDINKLKYKIEKLNSQLANKDSALNEINISIATLSAIKYPDLNLQSNRYVSDGYGAPVSLHNDVPVEEIPRFLQHILNMTLV